MEWEYVVASLIGAVVGSIVSIFGQFLIYKKQDYDYIKEKITGPLFDELLDNKYAIKNKDFKYLETEEFERIIKERLRWKLNEKKINRIVEVYHDDIYSYFNFYDTMYNDIYGNLIKTYDFAENFYLESISEMFLKNLVFYILGNNSEVKKDKLDEMFYKFKKEFDISEKCFEDFLIKVKGDYKEKLLAFEEKMKEKIENIETTMDLINPKRLIL